MSDILACIKFGCKGTIATLIAEAAGDVGDWFKFRKFLPVALPEGIRYGVHASYNLKTMQVGMEVISTDEGRTKATELKGGLMGIYGSMYAGAAPTIRADCEGQGALLVGPDGERLQVHGDANG